MKKIFTLAAAVLASFSLYAADVTIALTSMTAGTGSYSYEGNEIKAKNNNVYIELPSTGIKGQITIFGSSNKDDRFLYIYGQAGTVKDETRAIVMTSAGVTINYTQEDIITVSEKPYLLFSTSHDFKFKKFNYTYEADKEVDHVVETLIGAAINGVALGETEMSTLLNNEEFEDPAFYVEAPTVTFTVQMDTYYVGEETPFTKSEDIDVEAELAADMWTAQYTIGEQTYTITAVKPATATVTFMDGETVLGTEVVAQGDPSTKHANFETQPLAIFEGWFEDAELTVSADLTAAVNADKTLYGKFVKAYAQSLNIEQLVLDEGTKADIASILTNRGFAYAHINALDTLNDLENKANRNYAFLGLKLKTAGAYIQFNLQAGKTLAVKFGNLTKPVAVTIDGVAQADHTEGAFLLDAAEADRFIELKTTDGATVVLQQIMIGEPIVDVTLPAPGAYLVTCAESENGTVTAEWANKKYRTPVGETVTLTITPAEGYKLETITVNEVALEAVEDVYSFVMPAQEVTVSATFEVDPASAISNTNAAVKAVKVVRNGQLFIEKNGVLYNAQGAILK